MLVAMTTIDLMRGEELLQNEEKDNQVKIETCKDCGRNGKKAGRAVFLFTQSIISYLKFIMVFFSKIVDIKLLLQY